MTRATPETSTVRWWEIRLAFSLAVGLAGGFWGLMILFSDYPAGWSATRWLVYVLMSHAGFGLVIGALVPRWWWEFLLDLFLPVLASLLVAGLLGAVAVRCFERAR